MGYEREDSILDSIETVATLGLAGLIGYSMFRQGWKKVEQLEDWQRATATATETVAEYVNQITATDKAVDFMKNVRPATSIVDMPAEIRPAKTIDQIVASEDELFKKLKYRARNAPDKTTGELVSNIIAKDPTIREHLTGLKEAGQLELEVKFNDRTGVLSLIDTKSRLRSRIKIPTLTNGVHLNILDGVAAPLHSKGNTLYAFSALAGPSKYSLGTEFDEVLGGIVSTFRRNVTNANFDTDTVLKEATNALFSDRTRQALGLDAALADVASLRSPAAFAERIRQTPFHLIRNIYQEELGRLRDPSSTASRRQILSDLTRRIKSLTSGVKTPYLQHQTFGIAVASDVGANAALFKEDFSLFQRSAYEHLSSYRIPILKQILDEFHAVAGTDQRIKGVVEQLSARLYAYMGQHSGLSLTRGRGKKLGSHALFAHPEYRNNIFTRSGDLSGINDIFLSQITQEKDALHQLSMATPLQRIRRPRFGSTMNTVFTGTLGMNRVSMPAYIVSEGHSVYSQLSGTGPGIQATGGNIGLLEGKATRTVVGMKRRPKTIPNPVIQNIQNVSEYFDMVAIENGELGKKAMKLGKGHLIDLLDPDRGFGTTYALRAKKTIRNLAGTGIIVDGKKIMATGHGKSFDISKGEYLIGAERKKVLKSAYEAGALKDIEQDVLELTKVSAVGLKQSVPLSLVKTHTPYLVSSVLDKQGLSELRKDLPFGGLVVVKGTAGPEAEMTSAFYQKWALAYQHALGTSPTAEFSNTIASTIKDAMNPTEAEITALMKSAAHPGRTYDEMSGKLQETWDALFGRITLGTGQTEVDRIKAGKIYQTLKARNNKDPFYKALNQAIDFRYGQNKLSDDVIRYLTATDVKGMFPANMGNVKRITRPMNRLVDRYTKLTGIGLSTADKIERIRKYVINPYNIDLSTAQSFLDPLLQNATLNTLTKQDIATMGMFEDWAKKRGVSDAIKYLRGQRLLSDRSTGVDIMETIMAAGMRMETAGGAYSGLRLLSGLDRLLDPRAIDITMGIREDFTTGTHARIRKSFSMEDRLRFNLTGRTHAAGWVDDIFAAQNTYAKQRLAGLYIKTMFGPVLEKELLEGPNALKNTANVSKEVWDTIWTAYRKKDLQGFLEKWETHFGNGPIVATLTKGGLVENTVEGSRSILRSKNLTHLLIPTLPDLGFSQTSITNNWLAEQPGSPIDATMNLLNKLYESGGDLSTLDPEEVNSIMKTYTEAVVPQIASHRVSLINPPGISEKHRMTSYVFTNISAAKNMTSAFDATLPVKYKGDPFYVEISKSQAKTLLKQTGRKMSDLKNLSIDELHGLLDQNESRIIAWPNIHSTNTMAVRVKINSQLDKGQMNVSPLLFVMTSRDTDADQIGLFMRYAGSNKLKSESERALEQNIAIRKLAMAYGADMKDIEAIRPGLSGPEFDNAYNRVMSKIHTEYERQSAMSKKAHFTKNLKEVDVKIEQWNKAFASLGGLPTDEDVVKNLGILYESMSAKQRTTLYTGTVTNMVTDMLMGTSKKLDATLNKTMAPGKGFAVVDFTALLIQSTIEKVQTGGKEIFNPNLLHLYLDTGTSDTEMRNLLNNFIGTKDKAGIFDEDLKGDLAKFIGLDKTSNNTHTIGELLAEESGIKDVDETRKYFVDLMMESRATARKVNKARRGSVLVNQLLEQVTVSMEQARPEDLQRAVDSTVSLIASICGLMDNPEEVQKLIEEVPALASTLAGLQGGANIGSIADVLSDPQVQRQIGTKLAKQMATNPAKEVTHAKALSMLIHEGGGMTTLGKVLTGGLLLLGAGATINMVRSGDHTYNPAPLGSPLPPPPPNLNLGGPGGIIEMPDHMRPTYSNASPTNEFYEGSPQAYFEIPNSNVNPQMMAYNNNWIDSYREGLG